NPDDGISDVPADWHPWPSGDFERTYTWKEFHAAGQLAVNWACEPLGGTKRGNDSAAEWPQGKQTRRRCRGIIRCITSSGRVNSALCSIIVRPQTRMSGIKKQEMEPCRCGAKLKHFDCGIVSRLYSFAGGVHYINGGTHDHDRPTHILHLTTGEREKFAKIVEEHPTIGPLSLLVGRPGLHGPEKSVTEISSVFFNKDRIKSERRTVKHRGNLGKSEFEEFAQFEKDYPGFVVFSQFGAVTVIVMQTPFMVRQLTKSHMILRDAINGIVSDGAHGFFLDRTALLLMSSAYCLDIDCWVPGIMTYANGASQEHFFFHFLVMFESMAAYAETQGRKITDSDFKNVVDFSEAERLGFVQAFVAFWKRRKDNVRTDVELTKAGGSLLKGCQEHYRSQVTRIKKISAVVHPGLQDAFVNQALALLEAQDFAEFTKQIELLIKNFPRTEGWARWWARECHAKMLFKPFREMSVQDWDSIPNTTNAQESQHRKVYAAIGKKHELIPGLKGLHQLAEHYALLAAAASGESGIKTRYGIPEDWKYAKGKDGLSKRSRSRRRKDGRPPDTSKELVADPKGQKIASHQKDSHATTALAIQRPNESLVKLFEHMSLRRTVEDDTDDVSPVVLQTVTTQRDGLRKFLERARIIPEPYQFNPLFGWLEGIISQQQSRGYNFARSYFQGYHILLRRCPGDQQTPQHWQLKQLKPQTCFNLTPQAYQVYRGDVEKWFREMLLINRNPENSPSCWRRLDDDGEKSCGGAATALQLILGIPVMLILEIPSEWVGNRSNQWSFPPTIRPITLGAECTHGVVYDIVGRAFTSGNHFKAAFTRDGKHVYSYDDMQNEGASILIPGARVGTHLTGEIQPDSGWRTYAVVYHLRGGTRAQSFFSKYQCAAAQRLHSIEFSLPHNNDPIYGIPNAVGLDLPNIREMDPEDRFWLRNPYKIDTLDFLSTVAPVTKTKRSDSDSKSLGPSSTNNASTDGNWPVDNDSDPDVVFNCRCGQQQDEGIGIPELYIQCTVCNARSHIACQRNGRASSQKQPFQCDSCLPPSEVLGVHRTEFVSSSSLHASADAGKGALARHGMYWYPVRLILKEPDGWTVKWWRHNHFHQQTPPPDKVPEPDLRDELWANAPARRRIRLGRWTHACDTPMEEDVLFEFREVPYTDEIDTALRPHLEQLRTLLAEPDGAHPGIPAVTFSRSQRKKKKKVSEMLRQCGVPYTGELQSIDCARVANWFYHFVPGAKESTVQWLGRAPIAHAYTILIASRNRQEILDIIQLNSKYSDMERQVAIFSIAWGYQMSRPTVRFTDVDRECLGFFEERLFENSHEAGRAGNQQWGLDAGPHQDDWNPYANIPTHWNHDDHDDESESELQVSQGDIHVHCSFPVPDWPRLYWLDERREGCWHARCPDK
ncbi:hypothetical protein FB451DRAFT_1061373, partial [Mycena latifolia]